MTLWDVIVWAYKEYTAITSCFIFVHGNVWLLLSMVFQAFIGWGLFATAIYRVYIITTDQRDFATEFASYGLPLPHLMVILVVIMEFTIAAIFTAGIVFSDLVFLTSLALAFLMALAVLARIKGKESCGKMVPAATFGLVSLCCIVIDQTGTESRIPLLAMLTSLHGRVGLTIGVVVGDLITVGITAFQYHRYVKEHEHHQTPELKKKLLRKRSSLILNQVV
jgi:hypothetical protein